MMESKVRQIATAVILMFLCILIVSPSQAQDEKDKKKKNKGKNEAIINVYPEKKLQKVTAIGGNYARILENIDAWDQTSYFTTSYLQPRYVRIPIPLDKWEPVNDNKDPLVTELGNYNKSLLVTQGRMLQDLRENYGVRRIVASIFDVPAWMATHEIMQGKKVIIESHYAELVEAVASYFIALRDEYGVAINFISFNGPDVGNNIYFTPDQLAEFIAMAGKHFAELDLNIKFLIGDVYDVRNLEPYAKIVLGHEEIWKYLGPLSFQGYKLKQTKSETLREIHAFAAKYKLPVWCTALAGDTTEYTPESWGYAFDICNGIAKTLRLSGASVITIWEYQDLQPIISPSGSGNHSFYILKNFIDQMIIGSTIIETVTNDMFIQEVAWENTFGELVLTVINNDIENKSVKVYGTPPGKVAWIHTSPEGGVLQKVNEFESNGNTLTITLPSLSINTFVFQPHEAAQE